MAQLKKQIPVSIIGGGLSGLITAALLERRGVNYQLLEASPDFGGLARGLPEHGVVLDYGLKSIPAGSEISQNPLLQLKKALDLSIGVESWDSPNKTITKGETMEFVGFGETKAKNIVDHLAYYLETPRLTVCGGWQELTKALLEIIPEEKRLTQKTVTKLNVEDNKVTEIIVNGDTPIKAEHIVFCLPPHLLPELLPKDTLEPKMIQKMKKSAPLTAISLDIATKEKIVTDKNLFVLAEGSENNFFVVGQFVSNTDPLKNTEGYQLSSWLTFAEGESIESEEEASKVIKQMKKAIKKAFPQMVANQVWERLLVVPESVGQYNQLPLEKSNGVVGAENLFLAGSQTPGPYQNVAQALYSSQTIVDRLWPVSEEAAPKTYTNPEEQAPLDL